ncbi:MAG: triacylglycerol lipase [Oscillospiraceae bacterium]|nr:triacylglycerol lipase [Oscillospiraceae bacterium]
MSKGFELILAGFVCFTAEMLAYALFFINYGVGWFWLLFLNALHCALLLFITTVNGSARVIFSSKQVGLALKILLIAFWWFPVLNLILLFKISEKASKEFEFSVYRYNLNQNRKERNLCSTRYPLLLVHGVFFRDWENFNYWGRIPEELVGNGAVVYYGNHQSAAAVEQSAEELKQSILKIIEETNCEKVNIIAHSKGGIDSRYAISLLGMGRYVASLTTINTPHRGCNFVRRILDMTPEKAISAIGDKYEKLFLKLGDENPGFYDSLALLTDENCANLNHIMTNDPNVLYQSAGSMMATPLSAIFPLSVGHVIIKKCEGDNDGLVAVSSMKWGEFLGLVTPKGKKGISHGDMIDLTRKNIDGFDVCEFYVDLVNGLKLRGL